MFAVCYVLLCVMCCGVLCVAVCYVLRCVMCCCVLCVAVCYVLLCVVICFYMVLCNVIRRHGSLISFCWKVESYFLQPL